MTRYYRPIPQSGMAPTRAASPLAGGWTWFDHVCVMERGRADEIVPLYEVPPAVADQLIRPRGGIAGLALTEPRLMGIVNVTPDSFSDGGVHDQPAAAVAFAQALAAAGADILDIGGESTRPGADFVPDTEEIARILPIIQALCGTAAHLPPVSIDTRKAAVAQAALAGGARVLNDVSALTFDCAMAGVAAAADVPICLMHAQGDPKTMQQEPAYDNVVLDVYDYLSERVSFALDAGISRDNILVDPGIGFGKTLDHNLMLLKHISLFHSLGCPILLGTSRKRFIGTLSGENNPAQRVYGSVAAALHGIGEGVQITRVHDINATTQAVRVWQAMRG